MLTDLETKLQLDDDIELFRFYLDRDRFGRCVHAIPGLPWNQPSPIPCSLHFCFLSLVLAFSVYLPCFQQNTQRCVRPALLPLFKHLSLCSSDTFPEPPSQ